MTAGGLWRYAAEPSKGARSDEDDDDNDRAKPTTPSPALGLRVRIKRVGEPNDVPQMIGYERSDSLLEIWEMRIVESD